jgi:hypothetical protein
MPLYTAKCSVCGSIEEYSARIAERDNTPLCNKQKCVDVEMDRILTPVMGVVDNPAFMSKYKHLYDRKS